MHTLSSWIAALCLKHEFKITSGLFDPSFSASLRISRLSTLFLAAPDLFLDKEVNRLARACLWDTLGRARNPRVRFDESTIPGIESFGEFYSELISQFESVSYGDSLFALVVLLPTNRYCKLYHHQPTCCHIFNRKFWAHSFWVVRVTTRDGSLVVLIDGIFLSNQSLIAQNGFN